MKGKKLNLVGQKFNKLTCLRFVKINNRGYSVFNFQCDCGNIIKTSGTIVKNGRTKSCGCLRKEKTNITNITKRIDIVGQKFGRLTCIEFIGSNKKRQSVFKFECDCGNTIETSGNCVKNGNTTSCGCLNKEQQSIRGSTIGINNGKSASKGWCYGSTRMRSGYEIFYASILDVNKIEWEYEPETFKLENGIRYTPDFYLPKSDTWVEIKGRITEENREKMSLFRKQTGNKLKVYFLKDLERLTGESYRDFMKENKEYYI